MTAATPAPAATRDRSAQARRLNDAKSVGAYVSSRAGRVGRHRIAPHRCRSRLCPECGRLHGHRVRKRLLERSGYFRRPSMLSLSVDLLGTKTGTGFTTPQESHLYVSEGTYVSRLMGELGIKRYVWVLEFQQNGNPHWHVLFDRADLPGGFVDYKRAWSFWRDLWKIGGVFFSEDQRRACRSVRHAIHYITKYLTKQSRNGYPDWVWESGRNIRFVSCCRDFGRLVADEPSGAAPAVPADPRRLVLNWLRQNPGPRPTDEIAAGVGLAHVDAVAAAQLLAEQGFVERTYAAGRALYAARQRNRRSILDRVAACGLSSDIYVESVDPDTGEERWAWCGTVPIAPQNLHARSMAGFYPPQFGLPPMPGSISCVVHHVEQDGRMKLVVDGVSFITLMAEVANAAPDLLSLHADACAEKRRRIMDSRYAVAVEWPERSATVVPPMAQSHCPPEGNTPCETATSAPFSPPGRRSSSTSATAASPCRSDASSTAPKTPSPPPSSPPSP